MKIGKHTFSNLRLVRALVQLLCFIFLPALYISAFEGIKAIYMSITTFSFNFGELFPQIIEVIAIIPLTMLVGRFFCGWMCAFGSLMDFLHFLSRKILKKNIKVNKTLDGVLKSLKYIWLILLVVYVWTFNLSLFNNMNPWDAFGMIFTFGKLPDFGLVFSELLPAFLILLVVLIASFFIERFFCRYLCPMGAVFAVVSKLRLASIKKPRAKCSSCRACSYRCPMQIDLSSRDSIRSADCINCFECVSVCPKKNAAYTIGESDIKPIVAGAVAAGAITGIYLAGTFTSKVITAQTSQSSISSSQPQENSKSSNDSLNGFDDNGNSETPSGTTDESGANNNTAPDNNTGDNSSSSDTSSSQYYKDGTYEGSGTGFRRGTTTVKVTVSGGKITDVTLVSSEDTDRFINASFSKVSQAIVSKQNPDVDIVSGATYSSRGIMEAVMNALAKAK